jgi:hypothetical protein
MLPNQIGCLDRCPAIAGKRTEDSMATSKRSITSSLFASFAISTLIAFTGISVSSSPAGAVVYCQYVDYPAGCVARAGVVLRPRPVARTAARAAVRPGTPMNRGGPVNRVGRR